MRQSSGTKGFHLSSSATALNDSNSSKGLPAQCSGEKPAELITENGKTDWYNREKISAEYHFFNGHVYR